MKVYVRPQQPLSRAMDRVSAALSRHAPESVSVVSRAEDADLQVLHVIGDGSDALSRLVAPDYAVIQYCHRSAIGDPAETWSGSRLVWTYLPSVRDACEAPLYFAPLGVDPAFRERPNGAVRDVGVVTSGYVSGPGAEAIEEVALAACSAGLSITHLGPPEPRGMAEFPPAWSSVTGISDESLAALYRSARWVSGLRRVEGFELPVLEGLCCGARPIVFDRPDMRQWWDGLAEFVDEGDRLAGDLAALFSAPPRPVTDAERRAALSRFDWSTIAPGFWAALGGVA